MGRYYMDPLSKRYGKIAKLVYAIDMEALAYAKAEEAERVAKELRVEAHRIGQRVRDCIAEVRESAG